MDLSSKVVTSPIKEEKADTLFMAEHLSMKIFQEHIHVLDFCRWLIVEETRILLNFTLLLKPVRI